MLAFKHNAEGFGTLRTLAPDAETSEGSISLHTAKGGEEADDSKTPAAEPSGVTKRGGGYERFAAGHPVQEESPTTSQSIQGRGTEVFRKF